MRRVLTLCGVFVFCGMVSMALADAGTVANAPTGDLGYVMHQKQLGRLDVNDPTYLRLLEKMRQSAPSERGGNLDQGNDTCPATVIGGLPYSDTGSTAGLSADVAGCVGLSPDAIYSFTPAVSTIVRASLCGSGYDTQIIVRTDGACPGVDQVACNDDFCGFQSQVDFCAAAGTTYYIIVSGYYGDNGPYSLAVTDQGSCTPPTPPLGEFFSPDHGCYLGVSVAVDCRGTMYYTEYCDPILYITNATGTPLGQINTVDQTGAPMIFDEMSWDEGRQMLWTANNDNIYLLDPVTGIGTFQFAGQSGFSLTDGIAYDATDGTVWHSTDVSADIAHFTAAGVYLGSLTPLDAAGNPNGSISGICVGTNNTIYVGHNGLGYITRNNKTTGAFLSTFAVPGGRDEGLECDAINFAPNLALWTKGAYDRSFTAFQVDSGTCACAVLPDTCQFPYEEIDDGDLAACNYPTFHANPGHGLSGIAWLGAGITGEPAPNSLDVDPADDGVTYLGLPWLPCTPQTVTVAVTGGPVYPLYEHCGGHLYLNGWKDGNLDGDFCDELPCAGSIASEWLVHDVLVTPGVFAFTFIDPGIFDIGVYDGVFRWRLTSQPVGRYGFGLLVPGACTFDCPATFGLDFLGEVEDYILQDAQLAVELSSFTAIGNANSITLHWTTASESNNDHFELMRNGTLVHAHAGSGNTSSGASYEWVDGQVEMGRTYTYTLAAVDVNGQRDELGTVEASPNANAGVVTEYALRQNFPNPFNPSTTITFDLVEGGSVTLKVYNLMGQEVATLINGHMTSGRHTVSFNATGLPSGLYLYKLEANGFSAQKKMLLMK